MKVCAAKAESFNSGLAEGNGGGLRVNNELIIRKADPAEHELLTSISFQSKSHWSYPEEYFRIWRKELTITSGYIEEHEVFVGEAEGIVCAYYSLVRLTEDVLFSGARLPAGLWLDHMFVLPDRIGTGIGRILFQHCCIRSAVLGETRLNILADPNAAGFYRKMGCVRHGDCPSSIPDRTTPYLTWSP